MTAKFEIQRAVNAALAHFDLTGADPQTLSVVPAGRPEFGDYQFNGALPLAKILRQKPREIARKILENLGDSEVFETPEIAGAGFLNFRLKKSWIEKRLEKTQGDERLGVSLTASPRTVIVDFSSPNVAKPMHVGHIRSTIIGDCIARMLRFRGHHVVSDNHIGDWGTAFGKIIVGWKEMLDESALEADPLGEMERLYKAINERGQADTSVEEAARLETARLQAGDTQNLAIWERVRTLSQAQFDRIYNQLDVKFDVTLGESFYNPRLVGLVDELVQAGVARPSEGAVAVFSDGKIEPKFDPFLISRDGKWTDFPAIIRKSDGAATYATTDLATLEYRLQTWAPDEILYVTDSRQNGHFRQVFAAFERWSGQHRAALRHLGFGMVLGEDGKPLRSREGDNVKLQDLMDEAIARARAITDDKTGAVRKSEAVDAEKIAPVLGIGALKYADLSQNRVSDYVFSWDKMLSLSGNSAVYLLYAFVRTQAVQRKGAAIEKGPVDLQQPAEMALGKMILRLEEALDSALEDYRPHILCDYLYELAGALSAFWRDCRVLDSPHRDSRLRLVKLTGDTLALGLGLLGIGTVEEM